MANAQKQSKKLKLAMLGVGVASIAAATYFFLGPKGKQHQRHVKAWAIKMKGDIVEQLEAARDITEETYYTIVDTVAKDYVHRVGAGRQEVEELAADLKKHWKNIRKFVGTSSKQQKWKRPSTPARRVQR